MNIEDMPLEERQKRAGEELANTIGEPSALRVFLVMKAWKVDNLHALAVKPLPSTDTVILSREELERCSE